MVYQTTKPIKSLAKNGVNLGARQPVSPQAFTPELWQRLIADGVVVAIDELVTAVPLSDMTIEELKAMADEKGVAYTWNIKAATLIKRLENA